MKFGHLLKSFEEDAALPDTVCLNYKKLKKLIKAQKKQQRDQPLSAATAASADAASSDEDEQLLQAAPPARAGAPAAVAAEEQADADGGVGGVAEEDREFINTLNEDLSSINTYWMEKEEEAIIRLRALEDRLAAARETATGPSSSISEADQAAELEDLRTLRNEMVDFHGELVLMLHWSLVNYAAVAKILKKHDKMTGSRLRAPVLASVLHQPFLSTESISQLVKEAERHVRELTQLCSGGSSSRDAAAAGATEGSAEAGCDPEQAMVGSHVAIYKRTRAALHMLGAMQETAATPSTLLPPSTANSDAAPDGKKQRTDTGGEPQVPHPEQQEQQRRRASQPQQQQQQQQQSPLEVEAH